MKFIVKALGAMIIGSLVADAVANATFNKKQKEIEDDQNKKIIEIIKEKIGGEN